MKNVHNVPRDDISPDLSPKITIMTAHRIVKKPKPFIDSQPENAMSTTKSEVDSSASKGEFDLDIKMNEPNPLSGQGGQSAPRRNDTVVINLSPAQPVLSQEIPFITKANFGQIYNNQTVKKLEEFSAAFRDMKQAFCPQLAQLQYYQAAQLQQFPVPGQNQHA